MAVYVDDMKAAFGRMKMCHMIADTTEELVAMADKIGVARKWIQHPGTAREHFDIAMSKRALAVQNGAIEVSRMELGRILRRRWEGPQFPTPRCTAWEDCKHDGICHDPQWCSAIGPNHRDFND